MTTARDVIASVVGIQAADRVINRLRDAPEPARLELAGMLNPVLRDSVNHAIERCAQTAEMCGFETPIRIAQCIRALSLPAPPSEDKA